MARAGADICGKASALKDEGPDGGMLQAVAEGAEGAVAVGGVQPSLSKVFASSESGLSA